MPLAPILSVAGLVLILVASVSLLTGTLPLSGPAVDESGSVEPAGPVRTPTPSDVVVIPPDPKSTVPGTIAYVKAGTVWLQSGTQARPLTSGPNDSMPAWSADGRWMYYIRTTSARGRYPVNGEVRNYELTYPDLLRVSPGSGSEPELLKSGKYKSGQFTWFYWLRQPAPAPDGKTVMLVSDAPDPNRSNVILQSLGIASGKLTRIGAPEQPPLGHQDPTWRADGKALLYVKNLRIGLRGVPQILRLDPKTRKSAVVSGPGYTTPSYSPDGRYVAATKTSTIGTDVVILDARNGSEVGRVTDDGRSFKPAWSPRGDAIAFLRIDRGVTDLVMATIAIEGGVPRPVEEILLTDAAGLDPSSRPSWFIPPDELPPSPSPSGAPSAGPSPSASPQG
jgi:Tol biopolymer transport system component